MTPYTQKPKVLYVDDEDDNLLVFKSSFRRHYQIDIANSVREASELIEAGEYDLIISDQRMPSQTGVEFLKCLPDSLKASRIIMTGYSDIEAVIDALNTGKIHKYIKKPWIKEDLFDTLESVLQANHVTTQNSASSVQSQAANAINIRQVEPMPPLSETEKDKQIELLNQQVRESYENVHLLSEIGQEITSTLDLETILTTVYENVNRLMDASVFGIGTYNAENQTIDYRMAIENGKRYQPYSRSMEDKNQLPVWCIENKSEVYINDVSSEFSKYISNFNEISSKLEDGSESVTAESFIYMPLKIKDRVIGLIAVQSFKKHAYTPFHLSALRNIGIFVATALENSKAFHLIEIQKHEIEQKNTELEQKVERRTHELKRQKDELEETFSKLKLLTEIGQEITSSLDLDQILNAVYENVNSLMDASVFGIGIYHPETKLIEIKLAIESGKRYQPYTRSMDDKNQFPVWCIEHKSEIFINDIDKEYSNYISHYEPKVVELEDGSKSARPVSIIYIPLLFNNEPTGILTVQGFRKYAYNQYHLDILRSLASYIVTAIQNAHSYSNMTSAFEQLKSTQSKLVESEKMASLGVLTAGVAHEINNPVNFISGGIQSLSENYSEIKELMDVLQKLSQHPNSKELLDELIRKTARIDLTELMPEMENLINSIKNGAARTSEIVKGLRNFSRLDEDDKKRANLEEGIDNTLVILNNQFRDRIEVRKYYGKIPEIICFPGQLNQVFMNILYNAADAIEGIGSIEIKTQTGDGVLKISFKDSGKGMTEEVRSRIFEPFFTTKPVGKGTGLGLSISYGIIEKHKGNIEVLSEPGKGSEFIITLPTETN